MKQALVLAGGGAKGAYQAGCIKALQEMNFPIDIVTGTSIGAFNGLLVAQQDYEKLYQLWDQLTIDMVLKNPLHFDFSIESFMKNTNLIKPFFKSFINKKGADNTPLINLVRGLFDGQKAKQSPIRYGCCTVMFPQLKPLEITIDEMKQDDIIEYAIASSACFPAFPVHYIHKQGYIDGGYYDNLPIRLAFKMQADRILSIELNQELTHSHLANRENIQIIRPSRPLGGFLDFDRKTLDWRIRLGYLDTLKAFHQLHGHRFAFYHETIDLELARKFHDCILHYEISNNYHAYNISEDTPLSDQLKADTYVKKIKLADYLILGLELYMETYKYQSDHLYHMDDIIEDIRKVKASEEDFRKLALLKKSGETIKELTSKQMINYYLYHMSANNDKPAIPENLFLKEYLLAMFIDCVKKYKPVSQ